MKVLVCGSREWTDMETIRSALATLPPGSVVVNGGQGYFDDKTRRWVGADTISTVAAWSMGIHVVEIPANWWTEGKAAGPKRNARMLAEHPDIEAVWAFRLPGRSPGTDGMMRLALERRIPVVLTVPDDEVGYISRAFSSVTELDLWSSSRV